MSVCDVSANDSNHNELLLLVMISNPHQLIISAIGLFMFPCIIEKHLIHYWVIHTSAFSNTNQLARNQEPGIGNANTSNMKQKVKCKWILRLRRPDGANMQYAYRLLRISTVLHHLAQNVHLRDTDTAIKYSFTYNIIYAVQMLPNQPGRCVLYPRMLPQIGLASEPACNAAAAYARAFHPLN